MRTLASSLIAIMVATLISGCAKTDKAVTPDVVVPEIATCRVESRKLNRGMSLPGEILPYQDVPLYPKVTGFIDWIGVDRGSRVKTGQLLVRMIAPEMVAAERESRAKLLENESNLAEVNRRLESARAQQLEAQAKLDADALTYKRLKHASETPGVIAQNDVDVLEKQVEADRQMVRSREKIVSAALAEVATAKSAIKAAREALSSTTDMKDYLIITAPFDGMITERNMHLGSLAYPPSGANGYPAMLRIRELSLLRIVIPVPEISVSDVKVGEPIEFTVSAYPGRVFTGKVARIAYSLDVKTRTMPVELNYWNTDGAIDPGMFPEIRWPMKRAYDTMFVPNTAVAVSLEKPFVVRVRDGKSEWVYVKTGQQMDNAIEVFGDLKPGDEVAIKGTDEYGDGDACTSKLSTAESTGKAVNRI
jgi:RND family efflux transporter MFP subunit